LIDADGDGVGARQAVGGFPSARICGDASAANRPAPLIVPGGGCQGVDANLPYVAPGAFDDCCDGLICNRGPLAAGSFASNLVFPGQTTPMPGTAICTGNATTTSDFNCDGQAFVTDGRPPACDSAPLPTTADQCAARNGFQTGSLVCGTASLRVACSFTGGTCRAGQGSSNAFPNCL
jgi:hypothetical protein